MKLLLKLIKNSLFVAAAALIFVTASAAPGNSGDAAGISRAIEAQERHNKALFENHGVNGTAVSTRADGKPIIKIYTAWEDVPNLPSTIDGIEVEVQYVGEIRAYRAEPVGEPTDICSRPGADQSPGCINRANAPGQLKKNDINAEAGSVDTTARFDRPVPIGVSVGHPSITAGTIGCRVSQGCHTYVLSNNHVLADTNDATLGDNILQPGPYDGGQNPVDSIGTLYDFVPIDFGNGFFDYNRVDAALAETSFDEIGYATPSDGYGLPRSDTMAATVDLDVMKYGRTTGMTWGAVTAINVSVNVNYGTSANPKVAKFTGQIAVESSGGNFSAGGDSGSLIVGSAEPNARRPVALLFAGGGGVTFANPIDEVLSELGVIIDGD
jgi:hypothetical protein